MNRRLAYWRVLAAASALLLPDGARGLVLSSPRVGHIFEEGETIVFHVSGTSADVAYTVREVQGSFVDTGTAPATNPLPVAVPHRGLYELEVERGGEAADTRFAVVFPRANGSREGVGMFFTDVEDVAMAENMVRMGCTDARLNFWFAQPEYACVAPSDPTEVTSGFISFTKNRQFLDRLLAGGIHTNGVMASFEGVPIAIAKNGDPKQGPASRALWKWLVKRAVLAFPEIQYWEVWNEPDFSRFYTGTQQDFAYMVIDMYDALRELDPATDKKVVCAGFTSKSSGPRWLGDLLGLGIGGAFDILSIHYTAGNPNDIDRFKSMLAGHGLTGIPIWNTEEDDPAPVGNLCEGIDRTHKFIYLPADGSIGTSAADEPDQRPTVHAVAMRTFSSQLSGATFEGLANGSLPPNDPYYGLPAARVARFRMPDASARFVVWHALMTTRLGGARLTAEVSPGVASVKVTDDFGRERQVPVIDGNVTLDIVTRAFADGVADAPRHKYYLGGTEVFTPTDFRYLDDGTQLSEAEHAVPEGGFAATGEFGFSNNGKASIFTTETGPHALTFPFSLPVAGTYDLVYLGTTLEWIDTNLVSPFRWRLDDGPWHDVTNAPPFDPEQNRGVIDTAGAHLLGHVDVSTPGAHTVRFELTARRTHDDHFFVRADALLMRTAQVPPFTGIDVDDRTGLQFSTEPGATYRLTYVEEDWPNWVTSPVRRMGDGTDAVFFDPEGFSTARTYRIVKE